MLTAANISFKENIMAIIRIKNLKLRTIIGTNDWEREHKQDVVINVIIEYDAAGAIASDNLKDATDYKKITKKIIKAVETSHFFLLEKLTKMILDIVMKEALVKEATVRVDKPFALRFSDSVSLELHGKK